MVKDQNSRCHQKKESFLDSSVIQLLLDENGNGSDLQVSHLIPSLSGILGPATSLRDCASLPASHESDLQLCNSTEQVKPIDELPNDVKELEETAVIF